MAGRTRRMDEALANTRFLRAELGREIRRARLDAAMSQRAAGQLVGMSGAQVGRIERVALETVSLDQLSRACAAVGLRLIARAVPGAGRPVDSGQLALLDRLRRLLPAGTVVRTEVPLPVAGDRRAWDAIVELDPDPMPLEAEARLRDMQSVERRCALKLRDSGFDRMVLLVADTANNRSLLEQYRTGLRASFPLDGRALLPDLRTGRTPPASGILVL